MPLRGAAQLPVQLPMSSKAGRRPRRHRNRVAISVAALGSQACEQCTQPVGVTPVRSRFIRRGAVIRRCDPLDGEFAGPPTHPPSWCERSDPPHARLPWIDGLPIMAREGSPRSAACPPTLATKPRRRRHSRGAMCARASGESTRDRGEFRRESGRWLIARHSRDAQGPLPWPNGCLLCHRSRRRSNRRSTAPSRSDWPRCPACS
jgi:hypothetical protein